MTKTTDRNEYPMFEENVKEILFYVRKYGTDTMFGKNNLPHKDYDEMKLKQYCFDGFKIAQNKIFEALKLLQEDRYKCRNNLKQLRRERKKEDENELLEKIQILDYHDSIYRNLADAIAWQLLNGEHYLLRRLYTHEQGEKDLTDKSFDYVLDFVKKKNEDPNVFCLINDITNNIQLGDCLVIDDEGIYISEIKSGKENFKALEVIKDKELTEHNFDEEDLTDKFDDKFVKQLKRMVTQNAKTERAAKIIQDNIGDDPKYKDTKVMISESDYIIETYHYSIIKLLKQLEQKDWAYDCIEAIVHLGIYKNDWRFFGQHTINSLSKPFPCTDLMAGRGITICEPIFLLPTSDSTILDIVLNRIKIYIGVDIDKFIELANHLGMKAGWSTPRELHKYLDKLNYNRKEIFSFENKGIKIEIDNKTMFVGHGFLAKIIFDHILPSTMLLKYQDSMSKL